MYMKMLYMSSSFWLLGVESHDFSHAEKERTACKTKGYVECRESKCAQN